MRLDFKGEERYESNNVEKIGNDNFTFEKDKQYKALDGDETGVVELEGKILVRQPNSPKGKDWWCEFSKESLGKTIAII